MAAVFELEGLRNTNLKFNYATVNPFTNKLSKVYPFETKKSMITKINRAYAGFQMWRKLPLEERKARMEKLAKIMEAKSEELAKFITLEMGKPTAQAMMEIEFAVQGIRQVNEDAEAALKPQIVATHFKKSMVAFQPLGPLYSIQPWNFPVSTLIHTNA